MVVVINGRSGVGKDSLIEFASQELNCRNVSSVDKVKDLALDAGWDGVKDERGRQLLIDLKKALVDYNDLPTKYIIEEYNSFKKSSDDILFVHIREPEEIRKLENYIPCVTLLITRKSAEKYNLSQEDTVTKFKYDHIFENDKPIKESGAEFVKWLKEKIEKI